MALFPPWVTPISLASENHGARGFVLRSRVYSLVEIAMAWLESFAELISSACGAHAVEIQVQSAPPVSILHTSTSSPSRSSVGFHDSDWVEPHLIDPGRGAESGPVLADWVGAAAVVPVVSPLAEVGWLVVAHAERDAFDLDNLEFLVKAAELVEVHLDSQIGSYELDRLGAVLHANERSLAELQARLRLSNQELEQFAYIAAHELVAPLRSVAVYAEVLSNAPAVQAETAPAIGNCVTEIRSGVQRMTQQVQYLLALSRASPMGTETQLVDTTRTALGAVDTLTEMLEDAGATVDVGQLPDVLAHDIPLQSVFANLITNAVRYRSPDRAPHVAISGQSDGDKIVIDVADNARGIAENAQDRIFMMFERDATDGDGLGVGLAVSRRILEGFDASISVRSNDHGSTFVLSFPVP